LLTNYSYELHFVLQNNNKIYERGRYVMKEQSWFVCENIRSYKV